MSWNQISEALLPLSASIIPRCEIYIGYRPVLSREGALAFPEITRNGARNAIQTFASFAQIFVTAILRAPSLFCIDRCYQLFSLFRRMAPAVGTRDAEIKVPGVEKLSCHWFSFKAWRRSEYSSVRTSPTARNFAQFNFCLSSSFNFTFVSIISPPFSFPHSLIHLLARSLRRSLACRFTHSLTNSYTHLLTHALCHSDTHCLIHSDTQSLT